MLGRIAEMLAFATLHCCFTMLLMLYMLESTAVASAVSGKTRLTFRLSVRICGIAFQMLATCLPPST